MKKLWFMSALAFSAMLGAQTPDETEKRASQVQEKTISIDERVTREAKRAEKTLGLSAEQRTQWEAAARKRLEANRPLKEKYRSSSSEEEKRQLKQTMRANTKTFDETVSAFLTPAQKTTWEAQKKERRAHHPNAKQKRKG